MSRNEEFNEYFNWGYSHYFSFLHIANEHAIKNIRSHFNIAISSLFPPSLDAVVDGEEFFEDDRRITGPARNSLH